MVSIVKKTQTPLGDLLSRLGSQGVERVVLVMDGAKAEALGMHVYHLRRRRPRLARPDEVVEDPSPSAKTNPSDVPAHLQKVHDDALKYARSLGPVEEDLDAPLGAHVRDGEGLQLAAGRVAGETLSLLVREAGTYLVDVLAGPPRPLVETGRPAPPPVAAAPVPHGDSSTITARKVTPPPQAPPPATAPASFVSGGDLRVDREDDEDDEDSGVPEFDAPGERKKLSGPVLDNRTNVALPVEDS